MRAEFDAESLVLPDGWRWAELGELAEFINGDRGKNYPAPTERVTIGVPFINTGHITANGRLTEELMDFISWEKFDQLGSGKVRPGDLVYCLRGSTIGKIARNHFPNGAIASSLVIIRSRAPDLQEYVFQFLASPIGQRLAQKFDNGSAQPNLSARALSAYKIPLPPIDELTSISATLGALDDKIELNRKTNTTLEAMARALFRDWFVDFGPTRAKMEGQPPYLSPAIWDLFPERLDDDGRPEGWAVKSLGDIVEPRKGRNITKKSAIDGGVPVVAGGLDPAYYHNAPNVLGPVITASASGANAGFIRLYHQDIWASDCSYISREQTDYLFSIYALLSSRQAEIYMMQQGAAQPHIYPSDLKRLTLTDAPKPIWQGLEMLLTPMFELVADNERETRTLTQTRDLLLPRLMSGKLRVADLHHEVTL